MSWTIMGVIKADSNANFPRTRKMGRPMNTLPKVKPPVKKTKRIMWMPIASRFLVRVKYNTFSVIDQLYGAAIAEWPISKVVRTKPKPMQKITA